jgi:hypothetical protein
VRQLRFTSLLSLVRQGIALEVGYGTHSLEALVSVAETIEEGVYARGSLRRTPTGLSFRLANPPLRVGAFGRLGVSVNGRAVDPAHVRCRFGEGGPWRDAGTVRVSEPLELAPGRPTELDLDVDVPNERVTVRIELESVAIPPLVWVEFSDNLAGGAGP